MEPAWKIYEDAARKVLTDLRKELGIQTVEGKQTLFGVTNWEIDAKAWCEDSDKFLVIEVRRHTTSGLKQEEVAAIAYRIQDVGASGGVIVSPKPIQKGARPIAVNANISHVRLSPDSTTESYLAEFMGRRFLGATITESVQVTDTYDAVVIRGTPNP
jgi:hypothetical protein